MQRENFSEFGLLTPNQFIVIQINENKNMFLTLGMVAITFNSSNQKAEASESL